MTTDQVPSTGPLPIAYRPSPAGLDDGRYDLSGLLHEFREDAQIRHSGLADLPLLAASPEWEDRVRAEVVRRSTRITLPDAFPCLYEVADSPRRGRHKDKKPFPWVVSADIDMLTALLPLYQRLWDSYTTQWGPSARRVFAVGRLDGLSPAGMYRPGVTPEQVIGATILTHSDMRRNAPPDLFAMQLNGGGS